MATPLWRIAGSSTLTGLMLVATAAGTATAPIALTSAASTTLAAEAGDWEATDGDSASNSVSNTDSGSPTGSNSASASASDANSASPSASVSISESAN